LVAALFWAIFAIHSAAAGQGATEQFSWGPLPTPIIPADNPMTPAKAALGKRLFHDNRLSVTGTYSCATCHQPDRHFTDGLPRAIGALGDSLPFNTPTLYFSAFNASLGWLEGAPTTLEEQHHRPLFNTRPVELGFGAAQLAALGADPGYRKAFAAAFGDNAVNTANLVKALATHVRSLAAPQTAFDHYLFGDDDSGMSVDAKAGMELFFSPRVGCSLCHASLAMSGPITHSVQRAAPVFHVMGVGGSTMAFRAPTLRYVQHTAPYMHDGSMASLQEVLAHYEARPSTRVPAFSLTPRERSQLLAFLQTL
jgi:cytochrome c peroxidase